MTGYFRFPTIRGNSLVFLNEDDLWTVPVDGGIARRLTAGLGDAARPIVSPDGSTIAFTGRDETHPEVYAMPADGGPTRRLTYFGTTTATVGFTPDNKVVFHTNAGQPMPRMFALHAIDVDGGQSSVLPVGPAREISFGPTGGKVIGRNTGDPARWKRYKGGTHGDLWIDPTGHGQFKRLIALDGNCAHPMWIGERIFFVADHEGTGNIYSCALDGSDLRRHTDHEDFYARFPTADGHRIAYQCGGEIFVLDLAENATRTIAIDCRSPRTQLNRKFVTGEKLLESYAIHPEGHSVALVNRGKCHIMPLWEQASRQIGKPQGVRYRLAQWLHDGSAVATFSDDGGEDAVELYPTAGIGERIRFDGLDLGRAVHAVVSPVAKKIAITNHRLELILLDLDTGHTRTLATSKFERIGKPAWSPDGRWLAYSFPTHSATSALTICDTQTGETKQISSGDFRDFNPAWDPDGKHLYFISYRVFDPVYDSYYFQVGFPRGAKPYLVALQKDAENPFEQKPKGFGEKKGDADGDSDADDDADEETADDAAAEDAAESSDDAIAGISETAGDKKKKIKPVLIDLDGIEHRVLAFPVEEARYDQIAAVKGKVLFTSWGIEGSLDSSWADPTPPAEAVLEVFSFEDGETKELADDVTDFAVALDGATLVYRSGAELRALKAGEKPGSDSPVPGRKSGWLDLSRVRFAVDPKAEWRQMYRDAWRLMRDHFWTPDMSGIDWQRIHDRYLPLLDRVGTRLEFSDLMWEMQGELGTSHAYEMGGDHRKPPSYPVGQLGADIEFDADKNLYRVVKIVRGASWDDEQWSPLAAVGANVAEGDTILAIGGQVVTKELPPAAMLVSQAGQSVEIIVGDANGENPRPIVVKTLRQEFDARYREWVESNRRFVHERTQGRVGYVHVPNMGPQGFAEFHRYYLTECDREGLIVDVRYNGGGHVSQLLLEKLARKRIGYDLRRWGTPEPYPSHSVRGPMVCLTNEHAGSDGDIFSHCFKLMQLGPLVGKRTWGGVIGIWPRHGLVDGSITTQPEFSFWFVDVGFQVENHGTDPDFDIDIAPQDFHANHDPQMAKALELIETTLEKFPAGLPDFGPRPNLAPKPLQPPGA